MLKKLIPVKFKVILFLMLNYISDFKKYCKFSTVFGINSLENKECELILNYHSIEKGMLFTPMKPRFAMHRVIKLHHALADREIIKNVSRSQILIAYKVVIEYYELHMREKIDISDYYTESQYHNYNKVIAGIDSNYLSGKIRYSKNDFYKNNIDFKEFSFSRKSIRSFTGEKISCELIEKVIGLANNAPSVCNRQASKVYLINDKELIDYCLCVQGGFSGYGKSVSQLLILTVNREYFYSIGERNQFYIDGGIYLMNLLYSLHYHKIACCPANWGKTIKEDDEIRKKLKIRTSEQIVCLIPIGIAPEHFNVTLSFRRPVDEVLQVIEKND